MKQPEKIAELTADLQRTRADFENYRKNTEKQISDARDKGRLSAIFSLLPVLDNLDLAISAHPELAPLAKSLDKTLADLKLAKISVAKDADFNPDLAEAIAMEDGEGDHEVISEVLRPGYSLDGTTLRPALVKVKKV
jgi:molecular chaperone GrpE